MSASRWRATFEECLEHPDRSHLVRAAVSFDFRHVGGGLDIVPPLAAVVRDPRRHPDFIARLARTATHLKGAPRFPGPGSPGPRRPVGFKGGGAPPVANPARP